MILGVDGTPITHRLQVIKITREKGFYFVLLIFFFSFSGLTSSMYVNESDPSYPEIECPDDRAGLYIENQSNEIIQVTIPKDCLAFQLGAAMQLASADVLRATPHMVKSVSFDAKSDTPINVIARNTFAVFMQPSLDEKVGDITFAEFGRTTTKNNH